MPSQIANTILMIRPVRFGYNPETAVTNTFQSEGADLQTAQVQAQALAEFDAFVSKLREDGVDVIVFDDTPEPHTPDSIFPNNWVSFHEDGRAVIYPMQADNRRLERKLDILTDLEEKHGFEITAVIDLSYFEEENKFLEGTGSMVLDNPNQIAYACLSPRTHPDVLKKFCSLFDYRCFTFSAADAAGIPIYHTNVMMTLGEDFAIVCLESLLNDDEREALSKSLEDTDKLIIPISMEQMSHFAGNMLQVKSKEGVPLLIMSEQAYKSLDAGQLLKINSKTKILSASLSVIEKYGGGSARCMMAEIFSPKRAIEEIK